MEFLIINLCLRMDSKAAVVRKRIVKHNLKRGIGGKNESDF